jgi:putative DNA primase/helicase
MSGKFDTDAIKASTDIANVIGSYVSLKQDGKEFKGLCPFHSEKTPSFHVVPEKEFYHCFGCGTHGDVIDFITEHTGVSFQQACEALGAEKLPEGKPIQKLHKKERSDPYKGYSPKPTKEKLKVGVPVDLVNPKREGKIWKGAPPVAVHPYCLKDGTFYGYVLRLEIDGTKLTPQVRHTGQGWTFYPFKEPRPLYGLYTLNKFQDRQCLVVEGEKAADAIRRLVGDKMNVVTWAGGSNSVSKTDWTPLNGRKVILIPDRDNSGLQAVRDILKIIKPKYAKLVLPPESYTKGWDVADEAWSYDKEFFKWCKDNTVKNLPLEYDEKKPEPVEPKVVEESVAVEKLVGKHSIDSRLLAKALDGKMIFDTYLKQWFQFKNVWETVPEDVVKQFIMTAMDAQFSGGYQLSKFAGNYTMLQMRMAVISIDIDGVRPDNWLTNPHLLPMKNGVLNLETKELLPHNPNHFMNWCLPHNWEGASNYPEISKFLHSLAGGNKETVHILLCFLAAVLRGLSRSQKFLEIIGTPGTGKSTFIKLACELVGVANLTTTSMDQLQNNNFETANLFGKRLAIITDADKYGGSVEIFKAATGQDPLRFERKNQQQGQSFIFQGMIIVAANQPVQYRDQSTAMMRRRIPVHIDHRLSESERDPALSSKMTKELSGLIHDLVSMSEEEIENTLNDTDKKRGASHNRSFVETHILAEWLNECCVIDEDFEAKVGNIKKIGMKILNDEDWLYANYVAWAEGAGKKGHVALNTFRRSVCEILQEQGIKHSGQRRSDGAYIVGVRIRKEGDGTEPTMLTKDKIT